MIIGFQATVNLQLRSLYANSWGARETQKTNTGSDDDYLPSFISLLVFSYTGLSSGTRGEPFR